MKLVLTHLSVAGKEDAPMLQVEYAVRVPKALWGLERVHSWGMQWSLMPVWRLCPDGLCVALARGNTWNFVSS